MSKPTMQEITRAIFEINNFIVKNGYTYTVDSIYDVYKDYYKKDLYISHTSKHCMENLKEHFEVLDRIEGD